MFVQGLRPHMKSKLLIYLFIYLYIIIHKGFPSLWMCKWKIKKQTHNKKAVLLDATKIKYIVDDNSK